MADLTWHLLEVQDFWEHIITNRPAGPETYVERDRPGDAELPDGLRDACERLITALEIADPADEAWSWSHDHTVGFTHRRQAHEAFVHLADGIATARSTLPSVAPEFGADGVDELIEFNLGGALPSWAHFEADPEVIELRCSDVDAGWLLRFGRMGGTSPTTGTIYSGEPALVVVDAAEPDAVVSAPAVELDLWLWGRRPDEMITLTGDPALARRLRDTAKEATQ